MWKKDDVTPPATVPPAGRERTSNHPETPAAPGEARERASIGRSITIKGEVQGEEDLLIQGRVEGSVDLQQQSVTVGQDGRVKADINGRIVTVEGEVEGDLQAQEQVILRASARVQGDIIAPRVVLEDGASFKGLVDMRDPFKGKSSPPGASGPEKKTPSEREKEPGEDSSPAEKPTETPISTSAAPDAGKATTGAGEESSRTPGSTSSVKGKP